MKKSGNKRLKKKGLSAVVTTLIIILLVIVAVGIIWVVVRNVIEQGAEQIELGKFTLDLDIKEVRLEEEDVTIVVVRRNPGPGEFIGMNFIFSNGTDSEIIRENTSLEELEERSFTLRLDSISTLTLTSISVAPIYKLSSGRESAGDIADMFEVSEEMKAGIVVVIGPFIDLGFKGTGREEYSFSSQPEEVIKFRKAIVDPLDVLPGDNQTFTIHISSTYEIVKVTSVTELDNSILLLDFDEIEPGVWSASWIVNDTHTIEYRTNITATDAEGNSNSITLTWTDSCQSQITHGAAESTIFSPCTTAASAVGGVDGGDLRINADLTIASGSTFIFNQGTSIISGAGSIISASGAGSFGNGDLYYTDADGDGYASGTTLLLGSGDIRAKDAFGTGDCADADADVFTTSPFTASDDDGDGYTDTSGANNCVGKSSTASGRTYYDDTNGIAVWLTDSQKLGTSDCNDNPATGPFVWANGYGRDDDSDNYGQSTFGCNNGAAPFDGTAGQDCCDSDANAHPGQTAWFTTARTTCGGFDYDCVGGDVKRWTGTGGVCGTPLYFCEGSCTAISPCGMPDACSCSGVSGVGSWIGGLPACGVNAQYVGSTTSCTPGCPSRTQGCH